MNIEKQMTLFKNKYRIESTRLKGWDYSWPGYYFITICTKNREHYFGEIVDGKMVLNANGQILNNCWFDLPNHYNNLILDEYIIMPNHFHGIISIPSTVETGFKPVSTVDNKPVSTENDKHGLFEFVRALKTFSARKINYLNQVTGRPLWQPRFHDHIIRNNDELNRICNYIRNNPLNWHNDDYNHDSRKAS